VPFHTLDDESPSGTNGSRQNGSSFVCVDANSKTLPEPVAGEIETDLSRREQKGEKWGLQGVTVAVAVAVPLILNSTQLG